MLNLFKNLRSYNDYIGVSKLIFSLSTHLYYVRILDMWSWLCYCRKTKALENILDEKHKRRKVAEEEKTNSEREQRLQEKSKITVLLPGTSNRTWF